MILSPPERRPACSGLGWPRPSASSHGRALSLLVVAFFPFPEGGGEDEEEEEEQREGCCTWAGEDSLAPGFPSLWDSLFLATSCDRRCHTTSTGGDTLA